MRHMIIQSKVHVVYWYSFVTPHPKKVSSGNQLPSSGHCSPASSSISNLWFISHCLQGKNANILPMTSMGSFGCCHFLIIIVSTSRIWWMMKDWGGLGFVQLIRLGAFALMRWFDCLIYWQVFEAGMDLGF